MGAKSAATLLGFFCASQEFKGGFRAGFSCVVMYHLTLASLNVRARLHIILSGSAQIYQLGLEWQ